MMPLLQGLSWALACVSIGFLVGRWSAHALAQGRFNTASVRRR